MPEPARTHPRRNGKFVAIAMIVLWLAVLIAVYVVIVRLKLGGEEGIKRERPETTHSTPASG